MEDPFYEFSAQYRAPLLRKPHAERPRSHHMLLLGVMAAFFIMFWVKMSYESAYERMAESMSMVVMASPVLLILAVHWLSSSSPPSTIKNNTYQAENPSVLQHSAPRNRNSPWGVGLVLLFLMVLISYQSDVQNRAWFPMRRTRRRYY